MSWCISSWVYPVWDSLHFLDLIDSFLSRIGKISTIISSIIFSCPFFFSSSSGTPIIRMLVHLILSQRSLRLSSIFCILFRLFCYSYVLLLTSSFMSVNICIIYLGWPMRRKWQPTPVFLPEASHGHRSLTGYSPWGRKESDTTKQLSLTHSKLVIAFLPRSKCLLISWLDSPSTVILEPRKSLSLFPLFPHLFAMKWWDWMLWS